MQSFIGPTLLAGKEAQPREKPFEIYDSRLSGFTLRVQPTGVRSYYARFGRNRRVPLGHVGSIEPDEARERCLVRVRARPDLIVRDESVITRPDMRSKHDKSLSGHGALLKTDPAEANPKADLIIKNTYRTLMTRGIKGCSVYFTDKDAERFVRERISFDRDPELLAQVAEPR